MAKIKGKGTALLLSITGTYTAVPQLTSISVSGEKAETYDSTTLDGGVFKTKDHSGYSETSQISAEGFYDPGNAVHTAWSALISTPPATSNNVKITYTDSGPTSVIYAGVGFGIDKSVAPGDGTKATFTCESTGAPA